MHTTPAVESLSSGSFRSRVYARIGLLGNPSDGYNGRVLALSLANFWADVTIRPASEITFELNPEGDPTQFTDLKSSAYHIDGHGYNGGVRLLMSMTRQFVKYCSAHGIPLDTATKFSLSYATTIPRQRGLSGSSAISCAALNCLLAFYNVSEENFPVDHRPRLILAAEEALGITAGLQDRIIQVYGGLVSMDFSDFSKENLGLPQCRSLDPGLLPASPPLVLIYNPTKAPGKDSGLVHSNFKEKWTEGDQNLRDQMKEIADLVPLGIAALQEENFQKLARLMKRNFQLRKAMFGQNALGKESLKMIELAESVGVAAKFTGSGGAVVALPLNEGEKEKLEDECRASGLAVVPVRVAPVYHLV